jgi:hypothetical protein
LKVYRKFCKMIRGSSLNSKGLVDIGEQHQEQEPLLQRNIYNLLHYWVCVLMVAGLTPCGSFYFYFRMFSYYLCSALFFNFLYYGAIPLQINFYFSIFCPPVY